ncbi:MAG: PhnD/SsuA/transferrin family substrate-binding protein [Gallionella sp.]|jgi:phosphonate transport system substrate-binding protein
MTSKVFHERSVELQLKVDTALVTAKAKPAEIDAALYAKVQEVVTRAVQKLAGKARLKLEFAKPSLLKFHHLCCALCLLGSMEAGAEQLVLHFATYASELPSEELKKMEPFHLYLEQALAKQGIQMEIKMRIFPTYDEAVDAVVRGETDFARLGPVNYIIAKEQNPHIQLLAVESNHGEKSFNGVIVVAADSPIQTLSALRGKRIAFGETNSTTGHYLAEEALMQAGITGRDLAEHNYLGRHDKVAFAVAAGNYDAGAVNETTLEKYSKIKYLRSIFSYTSPTHAWVSRVGLEASLFKHLQRALLEMKGPALAYIGRDGFLQAVDADYDSLRSSIRKAKTFEN